MKPTHWRVIESNLFHGPHFVAPLVDYLRPTACELPLTWKTWRRVAPNLVVHPLFGPGVAIATDGVIGTVDFGTERPYGTEVALGQTFGPFIHEVIHPDDWNYERNVRRPFADGWLDWSVPESRRITEFEFEAYAAIGRGAKPEDFQKILTQLIAAAASAKHEQRRPSANRPISRRQQILSMI